MNQLVSRFERGDSFVGNLGRLPATPALAAWDVGLGQGHHRDHQGAISRSRRSTIRSLDSVRPRAIAVQETPDELLQILLLDRDATEAFALRRAFENCRTARLAYTADVETAARMLASQHWDLVAVDPALPGDFDRLKRVKASRRWLATLVVTHNQSPQFMREAVKSRIDGLLFKPVIPAEFMEQALLLAEAVRDRRQQQQRRVLAIGAHPDDVEIGCGGALAKHRACGDILHILTLSRGAMGGDVNVRTAEAQRAAALLGAKLEFGNLQDGHITEGVETIEIIEAAIRELRPTHVYTHCLEDTHQDHRAVHAASLVAARAVPNVYCYQSPSSTVEFRPNRFVDITEYKRAKLQAIGAHKSQVDRMASLQDDVIVATARYWGRYANHMLAEPMRIVRQRDSEMKPDIDNAA
ncbi:MAG TPA: PIG-L family deacetylase [Casimicrobiaceae bacterium]|jgi:LmbE family N-acetylglucosaminyl deacetylase|nr:PIG-L family deacetylase [Casimicrobiaceae bacterium]